MPSSSRRSSSAPPSGGFGRVAERAATVLGQRARRQLDRARAAGAARWGRPRIDDRPVYLVAPAGHPNHGDEQILAGWLRYLRRRLPGTPVVVDCHTPGQAAVLHHAEHPDVLFTDTLWRLAGEHAASSARVCGDDAPGAATSAMAFCRSAIGDLGVRPALASGIDLLRSASVIHLVGGGFINDQWPHHLGVVAGAGEAGRLSGARVVATGQGLTPCGDAALLVDALRGFGRVSVRDDASRDLLVGSNVPVVRTGDDGWLALSPGGGVGADELPVYGDHPVYSDAPDVARDLVLCAQSDLVDSDALADAVARILAGWKIPGDQITVVESIPGGDRVVWDEVCARAESDDDEVGRALAGLHLTRARFMPFQELWAEGLPARPGQSWLTTRFHPHLFAAARGASGVAMHTGSAYYDVKHGSLTAAGSPWELVDAREIAGPATSAFPPSDPAT